MRIGGRDLLWNRAFGLPLPSRSNLVLQPDLAALLRNEFRAPQ